jgi:NAD(P)-dependent dehydrogenase (short-subunit alcohol dehydrogenase family)
MIGVDCYKDMRIDGKIAFITGAAKGIGKAAASLFAEKGASVVVADIDDAAAEQTVSQIRSHNGSAMYVRTDITDPKSVAAAVARTVKEYGGVNILYNNAGGSKPGDGPVADVSEEAFWRAIKVDLFGTWLCCKETIPHMINAKGGSIINTASMVALIGYPGMDAYTSAKGGVAALTRSMAVEYAAHRIRVNAIAPGSTMTDRGAKWVAEGNMPKAVMDRHLLGLLQPIHIAQAALFLASENSAGMTGHVLPVDSGMTIS